jgi:hypothetical protein
LCHSKISAKIYDFYIFYKLNVINKNQENKLRENNIVTHNWLIFGINTKMILITMNKRYLMSRNEQEAVSWINKKWKKVCDLIRKIFKKRTGEELLSSDENIMDALYRSYQLLGSNDYAMFDYYRSLTEQMRKEDVKVGEINEEEIFSKKESRQFHNRQDLTTSSYDDYRDKKKIHIKPIVAKELLDKLSEK